MTYRAFAFVLWTSLICCPSVSTILLGAENSPLNALAISPEGKLAATGSKDGVITIWELATGKRLLDSNVGKTVFAVAISADGQTLAAGCDDSQVHLWTIRGFELIDHRALACRGSVLAVAFSPSSKLLAAGVQGSGNIHLFDVASAKLRCTIWEPANMISGLVFALDGKTLASSGPTFRLWDVRPEVLAGIASDRLDLEIDELRTNEKKALKWDSAGQSESAAGIAISPDGKWLAGVTGVGGPNTGGKTLAILDAASGRRRKTIASQGLTTVVVTLDGERVVTGSDDGTLRVWNAETASLIKQWPAHSQAVRSIAIVPGSNLLASVGAEGKLKLWDSSSGELKRSFDAMR